MTDFDVVREFLVEWADLTDPFCQGDQTYALAALDRIEAEVALLEAENALLKDMIYQISKIVSYERKITGPLSNT